MCLPGMYIVKVQCFALSTLSFEPGIYSRTTISNVFDHVSKKFCYFWRGVWANNSLGVIQHYIISDEAMIFIVIVAH